MTIVRFIGWLAVCAGAAVALYSLHGLLFPISAAYEATRVDASALILPPVSPDLLYAGFLLGVGFFYVGTVAVRGGIQGLKRLVDWRFYCRFDRELVKNVDDAQ